MTGVTLRPHVRRVTDAEGARTLPGLDPILTRVYRSRGVADVEELDYRLAKLQPVRSLSHVDAGVELLRRHAAHRIVVVGDFDADGATSTALVSRCLRDFGFEDIEYLVPNRFDFGYGLTPEIVEVAAERKPRLLVTVDNGISSIDGVALARSLGIDVLVTDHHLPGEQLPDANVIINPNLPDCEFASGHLAGVGVAFYLMAALGRALAAAGDPNMARVPARYLDLVALGTIADVVRLDHNNRVLVQQGIARIRAGKCVPGIDALLVQAGRSAARVVSSDLAFAVGPRLNAAGRLEDMSIGIECLLTDDASEAARLAAVLDDINRQRRDIETDMREQAFAAVERIGTGRLPLCVALYDAEWHSGVVGLVAARVRERCHRPTVAFARDRNGELKGSGRSVPGVHMRDLIDAVAASRPGLVLRFGGHAMAAGLSIKESAFPEFADAIAAQVARLYPELDVSGAIVTDGSLPTTALTLGFAQAVREAGPWGAGFPEPMFEGDFHVAEQRVVGERHLKLRVIPAGGRMPVEAIAFNQEGGLRGDVRLAYRIDVNEYRGAESLQLVVEQITPL